MSPVRVITVLTFLVVPAAQAETSREYLSDLQDRFTGTTQAWGVLGFDVAAHAQGGKPLPLQIGDRRYRKGLGHHAPGEITVSLDGEYETFETEIGLQAMPASTGSVVFKIFVDGAEKLDSGIMRADTPAKPVSVPLAGAKDLRLVVTDAGDGMSCDGANWANARLVRDPSAKPVGRPLDFDAAPFARVVTSDPSRMNGARANRVQEYHAEDLFLDEDLPADKGTWKVPPAADGRRCIGLDWVERRGVRQAGLRFADKPDVDPGAVQIQCWAGESSWQGTWTPLEGTIETHDDGSWVIRLNTRDNPDIRGGTRKIRWIFPRSEKPLVVSRLFAWTPTQMETGSFNLAIEKPAAGKASIELYNCSLADAASESTGRLDWDLSSPLRVKLRYCDARQWKTDRSVIRVKLPDAAFAVAVDDIVNSGPVYVRDFGLFASTEPQKISLDDYKKQIAGRHTILDEVRHMPDQTLGQAMKAIHNPKQDMQPTMLSLACDNRKFIVQRGGEVQLQSTPERPDVAGGRTMTPRFGDGTSITRQLEGGWLPIIVTTSRDQGLICRQRTLVAPIEPGSPADPLAWVKSHPVCVSTFTIENTQDKPAEGTLSLTFQVDPARQDLAEMQKIDNGAIATRHGKIMAVIHMPTMGRAKVETGEGTATVRVPLDAKSKVSLSVLMPSWPLTAEQSGTLCVERDWAADVRRHWEQVLAPAAQIEVPDEFMANVIRASQVHCLMAARNEADGSRIGAWTASVSYGALESEGQSIIRGMDALGHQEFARRSLDYFVHRYAPAGFLTTGYTMMGTGWHLWTLGEHYQRARDTEWLREVAPKIETGCNWIIAQTAKTRKLLPDGEKVAQYGLMPPSVMADWNAFAFYFCFNGYHCAGLRDVAQAMADAGIQGTDKLLGASNEYRQEIMRAWRWTQARMPVYPLRDGTWVPGYPSQVFVLGPTALSFPGEDGNRSWCYDVEIGGHHLVPFGILSPESADVTWMMNHMEDVQFLSDGWFDFPAERNRKDWFNLGGFAKVQPYYCRNTEINAMRDDVKPFVRSYFNALCSLVSLENLCLQEHFAGAGAWNKTHETGYFLHQTRLMLVQERGDELWLAPFVTSNWFKDGNTVAISNAPTRFGPVGYRIKSGVGSGTIEATIEPPARTSPKAIVMRLRHPEDKPMKTVTVNGKPHKDFDAAREIVRIAGVAGPTTIRVEY